VTDNYIYQAFGSIKSSSGSSVNPFRYVGRLGYYLNSDLSQYLLRARHYDPATARFHSRDPLGFARDTNLYRAVKNNPIGTVDPDGMQPVLPQPTGSEPQIIRDPKGNPVFVIIDGKPIRWQDKPDWFMVRPGDNLPPMFRPPQLAPATPQPYTSPTLLFLDLI